jgi:SNF2 family DNA or RNA helicase
MRIHLLAQTQSGDITAANEAVKLGRLLQICCGASYDKTGSAVALPCGPRIEVALDLIAESDAKVIVFVPYTAALDALANKVRERYSVETVHGQTSKSERDRIFMAFQNDAAPRVLIANPGTASHGLTLTAADTIVWFAPVHSGEIWEQANGRIARPGQTRNTRIVSIQGSKDESKVYDRLKTKGAMQGLLLELLKSQITQ